MNTATKLLAAMRAHHQGWSIDHLQTVAGRMGLECRRSGGSHCVFVRSDGRSITVPAHRPIKAVYIKLFLDFLEG